MERFSNYYINKKNATLTLHDLQAFPDLPLSEKRFKKIGPKTIHNVSLKNYQFSLNWIILCLIFERQDVLEEKK